MAMRMATGPVGLEMVDAQGVAARLRRWVPLGAQLAESWTAAGRIVGRRSGGGRLYPLCQFDEAGLPRAPMSQVIAALRPGRSDAAIILWLGTAEPRLSGVRPADLLATEPQAVVAAARAAAALPRSAA